MLTGTNGKDIEGDQVRGGGVTVGEQAGGAGGNHDSVGNTEDTDTVADEPEATSVRIGDVTEDNRQTVHQHLERLIDGISLDRSHSQSTCSVLGSGAGCSGRASGWELSVDEVGDDTDGRVVGTTLAELGEAQSVGRDGNVAGDLAKSAGFLFGRLALVVLVHGQHDLLGLGVGVDHASLLVERDVVVSADDVLRVGNESLRWGVLAVIFVRVVACYTCTPSEG